MVSQTESHAPAVVDRCSEIGAQQLVSAIHRYWAARGVDTVRCRIEQRGLLFVVRGNLIAGLPPGARLRFSATTNSPERSPSPGAETSRRGAAPAWLGYLGSSLGRRCWSN
jgi:hypothetical protein